MRLLASHAPTPWSVRRPLRALGLFSALAALLVTSAVAHRARADAKTEDGAKKLDSAAMDVDFLSLDMKKAKTKLQQALKQCGKDKCGGATLAILHRDLGIVLINSKDTKGGAKEIDAAFDADATVTISKDFLDNPEVKKAWDAAKAKYAPSKPPPDEGTTTGDDGSDIPDAEGNLGVHVKVAPIGVELPLIIDVPKGVDVATVKVSYKTEAMEKYKVVEGKKVKSKYLVILDCAATTEAGTIKYFVRAYDSDNVELEHYGTIKKPALIKVSESVADEMRPLLPGDEEPKDCAAGATEDGEKKPEGSGCEEDAECETGLVCVDQPDSGQKWCKQGERKVAAVESKLWIGFDGQVDVLFLGADRDICKSSSWACSVDGTPNGRQDVGVPATRGIPIDPAERTGGKTDGGSAVGTKRMWVSLDYFVAKGLTLGGRLGYAFGGNPTTVAKFVPFHAELRLQYFFASGTFRPYALLGGGYGQMQAGVPDVIVTPNDPAQANDTVSGKPVLKGVTAYKLAGPFFLDVGLGGWLMLGPKAALNIGIKLVAPVSVFTLTLAPEVGFKIAL